MATEPETGVRRRRGLRRWLAVGAGLAGIALAAWAVSIPAKAALAQILLERAWTQTLAEGGRHRPWPGAEHWPVARLYFPSLEESHIVLEGDGGHALAFAPGRNLRSGMPGEARTTLISAHRDTHFRRLGALSAGDAIVVETANGSLRYRVTDTRVVDSRHTRARIREVPELLLVTCWPFDAVDPGGPQRFVLSALREDALIAAGPAHP